MVCPENEKGKITATKLCKEGEPESKGDISSYIVLLHVTMYWMLCNGAYMAAHMPAS